MCGICGVFRYGDGVPVSEPVLRSMLAVIEHRGPDDEAVYRDHDLGLGMRRLSIIDLDGGRQPIYNEDGGVVVMFNGEIYNYTELRDKLRKRGHQFATNSDTEVIVHLYEDMGADCVHELRGMFAFAVWDIRQRRLFIARDRLGVKPLYYAVTSTGIVFGSEIKSILQHPTVSPHLDMAGLSNFLSLKYVPAPQTMFQGVQALPPGHRMTVDSGGVRIDSYWDVVFATEFDSRRTEDDYAEELEALLRESVRLELMSDVPFGAFLSGGIDSSTVVALMSHFLNEPVKTFSVGFSGPGVEGFSELPYARMVAERYETDHHEIFVTANDLINLAEKVIWHLDQPIGDEAALTNYMVAELASRHVKMVLTGEGGDELFAGYARYAGERYSPVFKHLPQPAKSLLLSMSSRVPGFRRPKLALYALCQPDEVSRLVNWFPLFNPDRKAALLTDAFSGALANGSAKHVFKQHLARTNASNVLNRMLYVDTKLWLPDDLLARGDKTSMAASLEARVPLLDHKVVEFAASLPPHLKLKGLQRKYLLKRVSRRLLPSEVIDRKKKGFPVPTSVWFRNEARSFLRDHLSPATIKQRGLFNPAYVTQLMDEHETEFADHGLLLWALLSIELWHRVFIDEPVRQSTL